MTDMNGIAAPLAAALSAKGYETLTPVQESMLAPEVAGRDLLVSAQTGSGKTVAFGIAIAPTLLDGAERFLYSDTPLALVIAPTRELALQVKRELDWLYGPAGAQIASCVGGMDFRNERRTLERGAHIVVGTPGRLRDHIERNSLDLSGLRAAVLDEADEMLDLGFREDLEFILGAAPEERRTLMFSATVPKAIAELAKEFQHDALRIQTAGEAKQHIDIEYRALNVTARDRENAIFNVLRYYEAPAAIVFCKTRANVNHLMTRMGNRGFQVVALSGELSQQERTHALQALRDGRARVCIATDVAARGIDLPGLELVIHADLPSNSETLLHRSGRTGRAGQKGVSALIVAPADFRKAQRLLQGAKVVAEWAKAPSADEVTEKDNMRLLDHEALAEPIAEEDTAMVGHLLTQFGPEQVAAAFVRLWRAARSAPEELHEAPQAVAGPPRERAEFGDSVWFSISVGRSGRAEARWLLPKICDAGGITKAGIGAIRVQEDETFVQIGKDVAARFGEGLELETGVTLTRLAGEPSLDRPERAPRRSHDDKPERRAPAPRAPREDSEAPRKPRAKRADDAAPAPRPVIEEPGMPRALLDDAPAAAPARKPRAASAAPRPAPRAAGEGPGGKPWVKRDDGDRKPYVKRDDAPARKPYAKAGDGDRKPYAKREDGDRKPYVKRDDAPARKPYAKAADGDRKPYAKAADGERKPRAPRKEGASGPEARPFRAGAEGGKGKGGFSKPFAGKPKPAPRKVDASDTSKRFVPPKKTKG